MTNNFVPSMGFLTKTIRNTFLTEKVKDGTMDFESAVNSMTLYANEDKSEPLYFWQLYNILGEKPVYKLIKIFYTKIFEDTDAEWFREEFVDLGDIDYHVNGQANFWLDIMGGGKRYTGKEKLLSKKHKLVKNIMTRKGADRWMMHMVNAIKEVDISPEFNDKRIIYCLYEFLDFFVNKYAIEFDFNYVSIFKKNFFLKSKI